MLVDSWKKIILLPKKVEYVVYGLIALVIMLPLLRPGFVLTLDMVFTPKLPAPQSISSDYIWLWSMHILNFVLSGQVIEKIVIFLILFVSGLGMHRLINTSSVLPKFFGGIFYIINPFTYERWMAGQYLVLAGYALLPFLVKSLFSFVSSPSKKTTFCLILWYTALALSSVHVLVLAVLLGIVVVIIQLVSKQAKGYRQKLIEWGIAVFVFVFVLNAYWIIGVLRGVSPINQVISGVTGNDLNAFTTASGPHGNLFLNVLTMYGFWLERFHKYYMPDANPYLWLGLFFIFATLIVLGIRERWQAQRRHTMALLIIGVLGFVMACGIKAPITGKVVSWVITSIPLMKGFREPEKFSVLLVIAYVYFASFGFGWLLIKVSRWAPSSRELLTYFVLITPVLYVSTMPFGFANQLKPVEYPKSWYQFNSLVKRNPPTGKILFLPWHLYMSYDFSPRIIANPAQQFFKARIISGTDAELGNIIDENPTSTTKYIEQTLTLMQHGNQTNLGVRLANLQVQYILLARGYDWRQYNFLNHQSDLKLLSNHPGLIVYVNEAYNHGK